MPGGLGEGEFASPAGGNKHDGPGKGKLEMNLPVQYEGFVVSAVSRVYTFLVTDALRQGQQFTVTIATESFRSTQLRFQDGPAISYERIKQELSGEVPAKVQLEISTDDIEEYLRRHYPRKRP